MRVLSVSVGGRKSAQQKPLYLRPGKTINASHDKHGSFTLSQVLMPPQATKIVPYALKKLFLNKRQMRVLAGRERASKSRCICDLAKLSTRHTTSTLRHGKTINTVSYPGAGGEARVFRDACGGGQNSDRELTKNSVWYGLKSNYYYVMTVTHIHTARTPLRKKTN